MLTAGKHKEIQKQNPRSLLPKIFTVFIFLSTFLPVHATAQCSCSGAPLLGSLELPATAAGNWQFALTYGFNKISDSYAHTTEIDLPLDFRTHSALFEISYGLTDRISLSTLFSMVQQERSLDSGGELTRTRGPGDIATLIKYSIIRQTALNQRSLAVGIGPTIPLGDSRQKIGGILLPESLQPGTGSWDLIVWGYVSQGFNPATRAQIFATASYRFAGENWRNFRYGDEFSLIFGSSYPTSKPFDFSLMTRLRTIDTYRLNGVDEENTGGKWVNLIPGVNYNVSPRLSLRVSGEIPLYRDVTGSQMTTTFTTSISAYYTITRKPTLKIF